MTAIPFPLSSAPGERPQESAGRLINTYAEPRGEGLGPLWRRAPGLSEFVDTGSETFRGAIVMPGVVYVGFKDAILAIEEGATSDGTDWLVTTHGSFAGSDKLFLARNNNSTPDVVVVGDIGVSVITSSGVEEYPDADVGSPNAVAFLAGYFFFTYGDGKVRTSGINSTSINTLDLATAEQNPDGLLRPVPYRSQMILCGPRTMEVWTNTGNATGFPFSYSYTIAAGLIGAHAIAGGGDEFSEFLLWVADDNTVRMLNGYAADKVSPPDLDRLIEAITDKTTIEACVYSSGGHKFWQVSCAAWSWVFDLNTKKWHERRSYLQPRSRITQSFPFDGRWLCGDVLSGKIAQISRDAREELGSPLVVTIESGPVQKFPQRIQVARADFDFIVGVGIAPGRDPVETSPSVRISWTDDGGVYWSNPLVRSLGRQQQSQTRVTVLNTGLTGPVGRRWRLEISDPVDATLIAGDQAASVRAKS